MELSALSSVFIPPPLKPWKLERACGVKRHVSGGLLVSSRSSPGHLMGVMSEFVALRAYVLYILSRVASKRMPRGSSARRAAKAATFALEPLHRLRSDAELGV